MSDDTMTLVAPVSGDVLTLDSPSGDLARFLLEARDLEGRLREAKRAVSAEILARMDHRGTGWTETIGDLKISGDSPAPREDWDGAELFAELNALVDEGVIGVEAVNVAVETVITYKVRARGVAILRKLGGRVAEVVDGCARLVERERRVVVTQR